MDDEKRLIRKIQKNADRASADKLVRHYYDEILTYAYRQTYNRQIAEDLTQNIFISMLQAISHFDFKKAGFRTWLYKIATNKIIDHHRSNLKAQSKMLDVDDIEIPDERDFTKHFEDEEWLSKIDRFVGTFDAETQRIFRLKSYSEYSFFEISEMTKLHESTVKTKYYRMLKALRKEFENEYSS